MKSRIYTLIAGFLLLSVSACAALTGPQADTKGLISACNGYAATLTTLAVANMNGKLSKPQVDTVNQVNSVVHPICSDPKMVSDPTHAKTKIESEILQLTLIQSQINQKGGK